MGSRARSSGGEDKTTGGVGNHSIEDDEWKTAVAGGYAVLLCLMGLRCLVSYVRTALSLFKPRVPVLEGDVDRTAVGSTVPVKTENRPGQTSGNEHISQVTDDDVAGNGSAPGHLPPPRSPVAGNESVLGHLPPPRSERSRRTPLVEKGDPRRQPFGKRYRARGDVRISAYTSTVSHGVRGSALTSGDAATLSNMRLEWSGPKPDVAPSNPGSCPALLEEELEQRVDTAPAPSPTTTPHGFEHNRLVDVVTVALNQTRGEDSWYTSTKELQLASLQFCVACRNFTTLNLTLDDDSPLSLLEPEHPPSLSQERMPSSRVPQLRARRVRWNFATAEYLRTPIYALAHATAIEFGEDFEYLPGDDHFSYFEDTPSFGLSSLFHEPTSGVVSRPWARRPPSLVEIVFPSSLQELSFGRSFNQCVEGVAWPASLEQLTFGESFNEPIERVVWPASLQQLTFGDHFNYPIQGAQWPASLRRLEFGYFFDQAVEGVAWPHPLRQLSFGASFNKPLRGSVWPAFLTSLTFGEYFNQPIEGVSWPKSMGHLSFGWAFNQPIESVSWPYSIRDLSFGETFNQPIEGVTWPTELQTLSFGVPFDDSWFGTNHLALSAFDQAMDRVRWPIALRRLSVGGLFRHSLQELGRWIPSLEELRVVLSDAGGYHALLGGIEWPKHLSKLAVAANASLEEVAIPASVEIVYIVSH